jgi:hypothetical protein
MEGQPPEVIEAMAKEALRRPPKGFFLQWQTELDQPVL